MSENTNEVYLLEAEILRLKTSLAAAQTRAERAEGALTEAKEYLKWTLDFIYQVCGVADWETMISDEGTEKARAKETEIRKWLAQPHGEREEGT